MLYYSGEGGCGGGGRGGGRAGVGGKGRVRGKVESFGSHKCEFNNARKLILSRRQRKAKNKSTMQ